jgi:hypothetical protein
MIIFRSDNRQFSAWFSSDVAMLSMKYTNISHNTLGSTVPGTRYKYKYKHSCERRANGSQRSTSKSTAYKYYRTSLLVRPTKPFVFLQRRRKNIYSIRRPCFFDLSGNAKEFDMKKRLQQRRINSTCNNGPYSCDQDKKIVDVSTFFSTSTCTSRSRSL